MNCTTTNLSYKRICKNINQHFFAYTDFVPGMKTHACRESLSAVLRGMIYSVPKLSPTTISLRSSAYPHIQIAPVILMITFFLHVRIHNFRSLKFLWDWHMELHKQMDLETVLFMWLWEISHILLPLELHKLQHRDHT